MKIPITVSVEKPTFDWLFDEAKSRQITINELVRSMIEKFMANSQKTGKK